jgi:hypothetical protein
MLLAVARNAQFKIPTQYRNWRGTSTEIKLGGSRLKLSGTLYMFIKTNKFRIIGFIKSAGRFKEVPSLIEIHRPTVKGLVLIYNPDCSRNVRT